MTEISSRTSPWQIYFRGIQTSRGSNEAQLKSIKRVGLAIIDEALGRFEEIFRHVVKTNKGLMK